MKRTKKITFDNLFIKKLDSSEYSKTSLIKTSFEDGFFPPIYETYQKEEVVQLNHVLIKLNLFDWVTEFDPYIHYLDLDKKFVRCEIKKENGESIQIEGKYLTIGYDSHQDAFDIYSRIIFPSISVYDDKNGFVDLFNIEPDFWEDVLKGKTSFSISLCF